VTTIKSNNNEKKRSDGDVVMTVMPGKYIDRCAELLVEHYGAFAPTDAENRARRLDSEGDQQTSAVWWRIKTVAQGILQDRESRFDQSRYSLPIATRADGRPMTKPVSPRANKQVA
jgi:hypothetical protein